MFRNVSPFLCCDIGCVEEVVVASCVAVVIVCVVALNVVAICRVFACSRAVFVHCGCVVAIARAMNIVVVVFVVVGVILLVVAAVVSFVGVVFASGIRDQLCGSTLHQTMHAGKLMMKDYLQLNGMAKVLCIF